MDQGPVTKAVPAASRGEREAGWKLAPEIAAQTQGLVVSGFGHLTKGRALLLFIGPDPDPANHPGAWMQTLDRVAPVTPATPPADLAAPDAGQAAALAFTWSGLRQMQLYETALQSFAGPFREGMMQEDRLRRLGDRRKGEWLDTVIAGGPVWSANVPQPASTARPAGAYDVSRFHEETAFGTGDTVHAVLLLYARDDGAATRLAQDVTVALARHQVSVVRQLDLTLDVEDTGVSNEHFGFADGLSQPAPYDKNGAVLRNGLPVTVPDPVQGVPLGEILLGHVNGHKEVPPGPVVPDDDKRKVGRPATAGLVPHPDAEGFFDFGLNGSYLVVRELRQDVAAFWQSMDANAAAIHARDPDNSAHVTPDWLAARVVGRDRNGHLLCPVTHNRPDGLLALAADGLPHSGYLFRADDPDGLGCPKGSHVRRANPRDALAPSPAQGPTLLQAANNHRILRRARKYGPKIADDRVDDSGQPGRDRGLLFMCLNTDIARQFEFVQTTWLLNASFATLHEEVDPLVGPDGPMTIPEDPLRRRIHVATFVQMVGGDYFFLPSLPALRYLALP